MKASTTSDPKGSGAAVTREDDRSRDSVHPKYLFQWYQHLYESLPAIREEARAVGKELGIDPALNEFGLYAGSSACAGPLPRYVLDAIERVNRGRIVPMQHLEDELREIVKDVYGDHYDFAVTNTCESALRVSIETLFAPPILRRGDAYRARFITLYGDDLGFMAGYGRPFPPKYKNLSVDRSVSAGELGVEAKALANLDAILVRFEGAVYRVHGVRQNPVALLTHIDPEATIRRLEEVAQQHIQELAGFADLGYDTPGYGYGMHDDDGVPILKRMIGELARRLDRPFIVDGASCCPVIGLSPADVGADVMMWSMDKACRAPICGLMIGTEEAMVPIRKGLGLGGQRGGGVSSHSKAVYSFADPGRDSLAGLIEVMKRLRDDPDTVTRPVDRMHEIIVEEFETLEPARLRQGILITKSYTMGGTELNYADTWVGGALGIPIFTDEDLFANSNPIITAIEEMGVHPATVYGANMFLGPGMGNLDGDGQLKEDVTRLAVKSLVKAVELVCRHAGLDA